MNFLHKKLWLAWSRVRFLRLPQERRVRLEVTTDGRHLTFILVSLYEAGYGVQVYGGDWFFRELMLLRKIAPIPFLYGGNETECGISISDRPSTLDSGRVRQWDARTVDSEEIAPTTKAIPPDSTLFVLDYDYFSGLPAEVVKGGAEKPATRNPSLATAPKVPMLDSRPSSLDSSSQVLRAPYFMQPGAFHEGFHKFDCKNPSMSRAIRLGFYGTHHPLYYTKHFRFPILPRTPILDRFVELFSDQFQRIDGDNLKEIQADIAVSFDYSQSDQVKKSYLKRADYFTALEKTDFMLCPPGWCMPQAHNLVESMSRGVIPILNYPEYMVPELEDGVQCLAFSNLEQMEMRVREALEMKQERILEIRANVLHYYREFLAPGGWWGRTLLDSRKSCTILVNHEADSVAMRDPDFLVAAAEFIGRFPEK